MLRTLWRVLVWSFSLLCVAVFSGWITMNLLIKGDEIRVPDVSGKTADEASGILGSAGLYLVKRGSQADINVAPGRILNQDPPAGTLVKKNRGVKVVISSGTETVTVPDLIQKSARTAPTSLSEAGLRLGLTAQCSSGDVTNGEILAQDPAPGTMQSRDESVNILVSSGPPTPNYLMPDLIGRDVKEVATQLRDQGFQIGNIRSQDYPGVKPGTVIRQAPLAGYRIQKNNLISLEICRE